MHKETARLVELDREHSLVVHIEAILGWDQETYMPPKAIEERASQLALLEGLAHQKAVNPEIGELLAALEAKSDLSDDERAYVRVVRRDYDRETKLPEAFVTEYAKAASISQATWVEAKKNNDFKAFKPHLERPKTQERISGYCMKVLHYERDKGRLDVSAHPFTTTLGADDVRITTRYIEDYFPSSLFSTIHESGHALYEMGIDPNPDFRGTKLAEAVSMAVHESQSRLWENIIGRSHAFWERNFQALGALLGEAGEGLDLESFVKSVNRVSPSLIRTEADEVTYSLHVIARFELESALFDGSLDIRDVPAAWQAKYRDLLGIEAPDDRQGCLQDVHWAMGAFGYFPSYALGNLYGAQFWATLKKEVPDIEARIAEGDTLSVLKWLRANVHVHGSRYTPGELVKKVTGQSLDPVWFERYLREKYSRIYGF
jgi:carboxypeptidase Taq